MVLEMLKFAFADTYFVLQRWGGGHLLRVRVIENLKSWGKIINI